MPNAAKERGGGQNLATFCGCPSWIAPMRLAFWPSYPLYDIVTSKDFSLEHTKPIFNERKLLTLHHLHVYHTFCGIVQDSKIPNTYILI